MSAEENKAIAHRYIEEAWNKGNPGRNPSSPPFHEVDQEIGQSWLPPHRLTRGCRLRCAWYKSPTATSATPKALGDMELLGGDWHEEVC